MGKKASIEELKSKYMTVEMEDGRQFCIPVMLIARNRAEDYKSEFGNDVERSLDEDTLPLFADDEYEIQDWASNNMNWEDVEEHASEIETVPENEPDYQEGWVNGRKGFVTGTPWEMPTEK